MNAYICDRCGAAFRYMDGAVKVTYYFDSGTSEFHICENCKTELSKWIGASFTSEVETE